MKILLAVCLLLVFHHAAAQLNCTNAVCTDELLDCGKRGCMTYDGCCESCCDRRCVTCKISPCLNWACQGHPELTCREDYCGACQRHWFDDQGRRSECEREIRVSFIFSPCYTPKANY